MKRTITGTAKLLNVSEGNLSLQYDKETVKWFKEHVDYDNPLFEIIYMNYEKLANEIGKLTGVIFDEYIDYPYADEHYVNCMDFHTGEEISDAKIRKALKGKVFTIKLKAERF